MSEQDRSLEMALDQMEAQAAIFSQRAITEAHVRANYMAKTREMASEIRREVQLGRMTNREGAQLANQLRNDILEASRMRSSDIGRAYAQSLKAKGLSLSALEERYAEKIFRRSFGQLNQTQRNQVYLEIVEASGRSRPSVNAAAGRLRVLGRSLMVVTIGISVYNIASAEDKTTAAAREGATIGGGFLGGAAGGAAAGLVCGPGAPVCSTIGVVVGGALGALGADYAFGWFFD